MTEYDFETILDNGWFFNLFAHKQIWKGDNVFHSRPVVYVTSSNYKRRNTYYWSGQLKAKMS